MQKKSSFKAKQKRKKTPAPPKKTKIEDLESDEEDEEVLPKRPPASVRNGPGGYDISDEFGEEPDTNRDVSRLIKQESDTNDKPSGSSNLMAAAMAMQKERESS